MSQAPDDQVSADAPIREWRQGDYALDVGGFLFADVSEGDDAFDPREQTEDIVGFVVISQTCDIVRDTSGRFYVAVCPLVNVREEEINAIKKGRRPYLTDIENTAPHVFADLRRVMSVHKNLLASWDRHDGFLTESARLRFAAALERKFGQFAFPDDFDHATKEFRERVWQRHDREASDIGKVYRSILQIRFRSSPNWKAERKSITVVAVLREEEELELSRESIGKELNDSLNKIAWSDGYEWNEPRLIVLNANELSASDVIHSQRADFDFLCY